MRILLTASKIDFPKLAVAVQTVRDKMKNTAQIISGDDIDWPSILETEGSWDGVYAWTKRAFDGLILVETDEGGLGRGTYEMAKLFLEANLPVGVIRNKELKEVRSVRLSDQKNWISNYGVVEVKEDV